MDGIPYAVRATNGKHAVSPGAIWRSFTARTMSDTAPPSVGLLPAVATPEAASETDPVILAFGYRIGHILLLAIHGPDRLDRGRFDVPPALARPVPHQHPNPATYHDAPHDPRRCDGVFSPAIRRQMQTFRYSRSLLHRHGFLGAATAQPLRGRGWFGSWICQNGC